MKRKKDEVEGFYSRLEKLVGFFRHAPGSGLLLCACDSPDLVRQVNQRVVGKTGNLNLEVREIHLTSENLSDWFPRISDAAGKGPNGLIINNLDELVRISRGEFLLELNHSRERLIALKVPMLFWLSGENVSLFANRAPDLFLRRDRGVMHFSEEAVQEEESRVEEAMAAHKGMRGRFEDQVLDISLSALRAQREDLQGLLAALRGSGAVAQGERWRAASHRAVLVEGDLNKSVVVTGDRNVVYTGVQAPGALEVADDALLPYLRFLRDSNLHLLMRGLDLEASDPSARQHRMGLAGLYVGLDTKTQKETEAVKKRRAPEPGPTPGKEVRPLSASEAVVKSRNMVLLGDPGSGKSTFLNHLTLCLSAERVDPDGQWISRLPGWPEKDSRLLPIPVVMRDFSHTVPPKPPKAEPRHLWEFIRTRLEDTNLGLAAEPLHASLERGEALVLLDGLDEVQGAEQRSFVRDAVASFPGRYPKARIIVTCRVLSYQDSALQLTDFPVFELAPFDKEKIALFIQAWYRELEDSKVLKPEEASGLSMRLAQAVRRPDLMRLAPNPLLLTVMALVNTHKGRLPDARAKLYEETVDILLWRWDQLKAAGEKAQPRLTQLLLDAGRMDVDLKGTLWRLAYEAHGQSGVQGKDALADIKEWQLHQALAGLHPKRSLDWAAQMINTIKLRAGLLLEREPGVYTFPHRTFQEYLAGAHLSTLADFATRSSSLAEARDIWREVILLAVGRLVYVSGDLAKPLVLAGELCPTTQEPSEASWLKTWLAGDVLNEMGLNRVEDSSLGRDLRDRVRHRLVQLLQAGALTPVEHAAAGNTLAMLGDPRFRPDAWFLPDEDLLGFVEIPKGEFLMGSDKKHDKEAFEDELPQHTVNLPAFYIARYPVTVAQFREFCEKAPHTPSNPDCLKGFDNHPVVLVSWYEALEHCAWLTERLREGDKTPGPLANLLRKGTEKGGPWRITLPSEAQWEKAARGTKGLIYPWGDKPDPDCANYSDTRIGTTSAVGCFPKGTSPYGCLDMAGNVWEWTRSLWGKDWEEPEFKYPYDANDSRESLEAGEDVHRVLRGGAFFNDPGDVRCAYRYGHDPDGRLGGVGFRVVLSPSSSGL